MKVKDKNNSTPTKMLRTLAAAKSASTTLVSYYIPSGYAIQNVRTHLVNELATSQNIKSKQTRNDVQSALKSMQANLTRVPPNGLAVFASSESYV